MQRLTDQILILMLLVLITTFPRIHSDDVAVAICREAAVSDWVRDKYPRILDLVLPVDKSTASYLPKDVRWMVTVRITGPFFESESRLSLQMMYRKDVVSVLSSPVPSLLTQLRRLKSEKRGATDEQIARLISLKHQTLTGQDCPGINRLAQDFEKLNLSPVLPDELIMDGTSYEIHSQSQWGNHWFLKYNGPGPQEPVQPYPLLTWVETLRELFATKCLNFR